MPNNNVTEEMLRESVARGIPKTMGYSPPELDAQNSVQETEIAENIPPHKIEGRKRVTKSESNEYVEIYLKRVDFNARQLIYVSKSTHKRLSNIVQIVGGDGITLSSYVENILKRHLDETKNITDALIKTHLEYPAE